MLMAIGTLLIVIISTIQTCNISKQTQAILIQDTAIRRQANAADSQVLISRDVERRTLRAYVSEGAIVVRGSNTYPTEIEVINHGLTPAYGVRTTTNIAVGDDPPNENIFLLPQTVPGASEEILSPGGSIHAVFNWDLVNGDWMDYLFKGKTLYYFGKITYTDIFGVRDTTIFRLQNVFSNGVKYISGSGSGNYAR
jgi:hypothetical protein